MTTDPTAQSAAVGTDSAPNVTTTDVTATAATPTSSPPVAQPAVTVTTSPPTSQGPIVRLRPVDNSDLLANLGLLNVLPGTWMGTGFNLIWRPVFNSPPQDHFLELNLTQEVTKFDFIGAPIPNRGFSQPDMIMWGLHYLQQISDRVSLGALHIEPGIWINMQPGSLDATVPTPAPATPVARLATVPHGNALVAQGSAVQSAAPNCTPDFGTANVTPFFITGGAIHQADLNLDTPNPFRSAPPPDTIMPLAQFQQIVNNPNALLASDIATDQIQALTTIKVATSANVSSWPPSVATPNGEGGVENIGFLNNNSGSAGNVTASDVFATYWIEQVQNPAVCEGSYLKLQYSQTVNLVFNGIVWPHVSVGTLIRSSVV